MSRSFIRLRRALLGVSSAIVFGFGADQALAVPQTSPSYGMCADSSSGPTLDWECTSHCYQQGYVDGYCERGRCICHY